MPTLFRAPREFFLSEFLPQICLVTGSQEHLLRCKIIPRTRFGIKRRDSRLIIELFFTPKGLTQYDARYSVWNLPALAFFLFLTFFFVPAITASYFGCGGACAAMGLCVVVSFGLSHLISRAQLPRSPMPQVRWIDDHIMIEIEFPDERADVFAAFEQAQARWVDAGRPPADGREVPPIAPPEEAWSDTQGGDWDQAPPKP